MAGAIVAAGVLVGCGTAAAPSARGAGSTSSHAPAAKGTLTIEVKSGTGVTHWTLRCDPAGGNTPDAAAVCRVLLGSRNPMSPIMMHPMSPIMPRVMCPMIMISGKQIIVDGTWFGKKVYRVFIDGGCDLPLFNSLVKTLY